MAGPWRANTAARVEGGRRKASKPRSGRHAWNQRDSLEGWEGERKRDKWGACECVGVRRRGWGVAATGCPPGRAAGKKVSIPGPPSLAVCSFSLLSRAPIVPVVRQGGLGPDQQDPAIQAEGPAIVADAPVGGGQADVDEDAV